MDTNEPLDHDDDHPTTPLPWLDGGQEEPPAPGTAVTDGMKAGQPQRRPSFFRRHAFGLGVAAAVVAVVVVAGGTAWGVSAAVAAGNTAAPAAMNPSTHAKKGAAAGTKKHAKGAVGTVTAISGDTWTMTSAAGTSITVKIGSSTVYGTAKKPADASSFAVGDRIAVLGMRGGDTVTATRIVHLPATHTRPTGTPTPAATT